jgi:hypothetical protein
VGLIENPGIEIMLRVRDGVLYFAVRNRYNPDSTEIKDKGSGIGLGNVRRRLKLLYASQHRLLVAAGSGLTEGQSLAEGVDRAILEGRPGHAGLSQSEGWFLVSLELNLH